MFPHVHELYETNLVQILEYDFARDHEVCRVTFLHNKSNPFLDACDAQRLSRDPYHSHA